MGPQSGYSCAMILTDREIKLALTKEQIIIEQAPSEEAFHSTAVDLTLNPKARTFRIENGIILDPASDNYDYHKIANVLTENIDINPHYNLPKNSLLLAWTNEKITLPTSSRLAARVEGKSSLSRIGIGVHLTAPTIHAGFSGPLQLEIINHGPSEVVLRPNMSICQLIIEMTFGTPEKGYAGIFLDQKAE